MLVSLSEANEMRHNNSVSIFCDSNDLGIFMMTIVDLNILRATSEQNH